ncbi:hypothetical protein MMC28_007150 [Mycoblastus sanguinarius]|nr:hypothetical protein [Mycoblastus sanguinarius]
MRQAARALKSGGTLAVVHYTVRSRILDNPEAQIHWDALWRVFQDHFQSDSPLMMRIAKQGSRGLEYVGLDQEFWERGAKRILINCEADKGAKSLWICDDESKMFPVENREQPEREDFEKVREPDWDRVVEPGWFREYMYTIQLPPPVPQEYKDKEATLLDAVFEAVAKNGSGKATVTWPSTAILATRS